MKDSIRERLVFFKGEKNPINIALFTRQKYSTVITSQLQTGSDVEAQITSSLLIQRSTEWCRLQSFDTVLFTSAEMAKALYRTNY